jgi:hypothetical protein
MSPFDLSRSASVQITAKPPIKMFEINGHFGHSFQTFWAEHFGEERIFALWTTILEDCVSISWVFPRLQEVPSGFMEILIVRTQHFLIIWENLSLDNLPFEGRRAVILKYRTVLVRDWKTVCGRRPERVHKIAEKRLERRKLRYPRCVFDSSRKIWVRYDCIKWKLAFQNPIGNFHWTSMIQCLPLDELEVNQTFSLLWNQAWWSSHVFRDNCTKYSDEFGKLISGNSIFPVFCSVHFGASLWAAPCANPSLYSRPHIPLSVLFQVWCLTTLSANTG